MSDKDLIARGAQCVTGDLILRNKVVGFYRNGVFNITDDGEKELQVVEVAATEVRTQKAVEATPAAAKPAKAEKAQKARKPTAVEPVPEPAPVEAEPDTSVDEALDGLDDMLAPQE